MNTTAYPYLSDLVKAWTGLDLPLPLPTFGLMVAIAVLVSMWLVGRELRRLHEAARIGTVRRRVKGPDGRYVEQSVPPDEIRGDLVAITVITGLIGARVFSILDYPHEFAVDPWGMIFTRSGFSVMGGVIFGTLAGVVYVRRLGLPVLAVCDAVAPAMLLGYAIGRVGCQLSGDGDWGIPADLALKPDWVPAWLWAQTYDNNILGVTIPPPGVYPTPVYETLMTLVGFAILWSVRKHPFRPGWLFALYLVLSGVERLAIERIRVNAVFQVFGISATQAQLVSVVFIAMGIAGLLAWSGGESASPRPSVMPEAPEKR
jgi:phosphatidylglycerol:prolipoprotein diacylglycerol transferase